MRTTLDCIPCFVRQALEAMRRLAGDEHATRRLLQDLLVDLSQMDFDQSPPMVGRRIHRRIRTLLGDDDPYRALKDRFNRHALQLYPALKRRVEEASDPFQAALRVAIAGNSIDFAALDDVTESSVNTLMESAWDRPLLGSPGGLRQAADAAPSILYLADNAGEIVFDRLLIERLPLDRVTVAVRGAPVINDATIEDARAAGLTELVDVIDNGSDVPGTVLEECSPAFRRRFDEAPLILAKGMGNYETLNTMSGHSVHFLLIAKCPLVAEHLGCRVGDFVASSNHAARLQKQGVRT